MPAPIVVNFQVGGVADIARAFRTIEQASTRSDRTQVTSALRAAKERTSSTDKEAKEKVRIWIRADKMQAQAQKQSAREFERIERDKNATAVRWVKARERDILAEERKSMRARQQFAKAIGSTASRGFAAGSRNAAGMAMGMMGGAMSLGGGFDVADSVRRLSAASGKAADIANSGYMPNGSKVANQSRRSSTEILSAAKSTGIQYGMDSNEMLSGLQAFTGKTGDLDMGLQTMSKLAELATATGSSFENMANAAAEAFNSDTTQSANDLMITMRSLAGEGKIGAVEIRDLASQAAKLTASAGKFEGKKADNVITLGVMAQEAKKSGGAVNATEAATSVANFSSDVAKGKDKFDALGIRTEGKNGVLRGPEDIVKDALTKTGGKVTSVENLFGKRSARAVQGYAEIYRNAGGGQGDAKKDAVALKAVTDEFESMRRSVMSEEEAHKSATLRMQEADKVWEKTVLKLRDAVASELLPTLIKLAPEVEKSIPQIVNLAKAAGEFAGFLIENPLTGIGAIVAASISKELAAAAIGSLIQKAFTAAGSMGIVVGSMAAAITTGMIVIDKLADADADKNRSSVKGDLGAVNTASSLLASDRAGTMTPEKIEEAKKTQAALAAELERKGQSIGDGGSNFQKVAGGIAEITGNGSADDDYRRSVEEFKNTKAALDMLNKAIDASAAALVSHANAADKSNPTSSTRTLPQAQRDPSQI